MTAPFSRKRALLTGVTGQDGSYLTELLLEKGYEVHGIMRRSSTMNTARIDHLIRDSKIIDKRLFLHFGDLGDTMSVFNLVKNVRPDEIYNLGAQSHVRISFDIPEHTADITGTGTIRLLDAIVKSGLKTRFYQASSSEMFGKVTSSPQNESTPFRPCSPYACAKVFSHWATVNYREAYGLHASNGILYNHESPRRGEAFVTRKITQALARIVAGKQDLLFLGNLDAARDWGAAQDYVQAMWLMVQAEKGDDYVIGTGESHTIREFLDEAFGLAGLDWNKHVRIDAKYFRPTEVNYLVADSSKARKQLGWTPRVTFRELVRTMVEADLAAEGLNPADIIGTGKGHGKVAA